MAIPQHFIQDLLARADIVEVVRRLAAIRTPRGAAIDLAMTTTGIRLTQTVPAGATVVTQWNTPTSLTARTLANQRAADTGAASTGVDAANANILATGSFLVITGATAGNLQIRFASEVGSSNAVVKAGSNLVAIKVA